MFEELCRILNQLPSIPGITSTLVLGLPHAVRHSFNFLVRQGHGGELTLTQFAQMLFLSESETSHLLQILIRKGYLYEFLLPHTGEPVYRARFGKRRGRDLPLELRQILQTLKAIQLIEVISDIGASTSGASQGPLALRQASFEFNRKLFDHYPTQTIHSDQYVTSLGEATPCAKGIAAIYRVYQQVSQSVQRALEQNTLPIVISGDHSTAGGTIAGIKMAYPESRLGVVWIDAHADIHSPYTTPSGNLHGMPVATALAEDNREYKINTPDPITLDYWNRLKTLGGQAPKIAPADLIYVAVRDTEPQEDALIERHQIKNFTTAEIREKGINPVIQEILDRLVGCDRLYISFDVDSMDPDHVSEGTGTPVTGGLTDAEAAHLIARLIQSGKVCCFEICEINPRLDGRGNRMAESAFDILENAAMKLASQTS